MRAQRAVAVRALLLVAAALFGLGCGEKPLPKAPPAPEAKAPTLEAKKRPPFPNMATAAWGAALIEERAASIDSGLVARGYKALLEATLADLHSREPGSEVRAAASATAAWRAAQADPERATAAALLAAALTLEPKVDGYRERLTDAHGLAAYAGTLEPATVLAQSARAFVGIAAGRVFEGQKLVDVIGSAPGLGIDADAQLFLGLARSYLADRSDVALSHLRAVLKDKPESTRARALLAQALLELGLAPPALSVLEGPGARPSAFLDALKGRALVHTARRDEGVRVLVEAEGRLEEFERGQALYWLASALVAQGQVDDASAVLARLASRPGHEGEAALLKAQLARARGDDAAAKAAAEGVCRTRGVALPLALECQWIVVEGCASLGDAACVERWGRKAVGADGDRARLLAARARLASQADAGQEKASLLEAHLASPFDDALAARVQSEGVPGGRELADLVRGVRRALRLQAREAASAGISPEIEKNPRCRVCRALYALATHDVDDGARRAVAALDGKGPPLAEDDLIALIDLLGGSPIDDGKRALAMLAKDPRPAVQAAVAEARADLKDPERRKQRKDKAQHGDGDDKAPPGSVPVPSLAPPAAGDAR